MINVLTGMCSEPKKSEEDDFSDLMTDWSDLGGKYEAFIA